MTLIAGDDAPEVLQPGKEPFDLPAPAVTPELAAVLGLVPARRAMRRDQLDVALREPLIQPVAVVRAVSDQPARERAEEPVLERRFDEGDFAGVCTCDSNGERKTSAVCDRHDLGPFAFAGEANAGAPFFAPAKVASMKASLRSNPPAAASSRARALKTCANAPLRAHSWKRR